MIKYYCYSPPYPRHLPLLPYPCYITHATYPCYITHATYPCYLTHTTTTFTPTGPRRARTVGLTINSRSLYLLSYGTFIWCFERIIAISQPYLKLTPGMGIEPMTTRLKVVRSTSWANQVFDTHTTGLGFSQLPLHIIYVELFKFFYITYLLFYTF